MMKLPNVGEYLEEGRRKRARLTLLGLLEVPAKSWYEEYIPRTMAGGIKDIDVFIRACELQKWTLLFGPTGAGKTLVGLAVAAKLRRRYTSINFHGGVTAEAFIGRWIPDAGSGMPSIEKLRKRFAKQVSGDDAESAIANLVNAYIHKYRVNYRWVDGHLTDFFRNGGVLDLAEINMAPPSVIAFLFQMLDDRCQIVLDDKDGEVVHAHEDFWCIGNYNEGYAGTEELNDALLRRFPVKFAWGYSDEVEKKLITNPAVMKVGLKLRESGVIRKDVGTASLRDFCDNIAIFGPDLAGQMFTAGFDPHEREVVDQVVTAEFSSVAKQLQVDAEKAAMATDSAWVGGLGGQAAPAAAQSGAVASAAPNGYDHRG